MANMGFGPIGSNTIFLRKYRWMFTLPDVAGAVTGVLPPNKAARPSLSFKEIEAQHVTETVYRPGKPDWKPINLTLYDVKGSVMGNPVWEWVRKLYDPQQNSTYTPSAEGFIKPTAELVMYDGKGTVCERWTFETVWCSNIEFGDLDMGTSDVVTCDLTLRYDRAYIEFNSEA